MNKAYRIETMYILVSASIMLVRSYFLRPNKIPPTLLTFITSLNVKLILVESRSMVALLAGSARNSWICEESSEKLEIVVDVRFVSAVVDGMP